ncbi:paraquat-inducible protein A [Acinetobacter chinensis]|uniref:Paraquat-inducible protein A n=1 Tax=Acinetobacter chinensis TaxID=2004650 RepID=A0A3B7LX46_9GAMM|nr:paraquat-inducible protein A [Acinetobacter chinensis]AXY57048.1 paraquat-inducible protein A [Acinetobacter chinensis]
MQLRNHTDLIGCEECDAVFQRVPLATGEYAYCSCCGAELYRKINNFNTLLAMIVTALIVFIIANSFSIIKVELQGNYSETTLLGAAWIMFQTDRAFVGALLMLTTFIVPLLYILLMTYVLTVIMGIRREVFRNSRKTIRVVLRTLYFLRTWGMVEVFLIGILVTLVKLVGMVVVIPGIALWAIAILSVLLVYIGSIKIKDLWDAIDVYVPL